MIRGPKGPRCFNLLFRQSRQSVTFVLPSPSRFSLFRPSRFHTFLKTLSLSPSTLSDLFWLHHLCPRNGFLLICVWVMARSTYWTRPLQTLSHSPPFSLLFLEDRTSTSRLV